MFDNIHFNKTVYHKGRHPISKIFPDELPVEYSLNLPAEYSFELPDNTVFFRDCSYCLEGIGLSCSNHPLTKFALDNFFYIQSFSIMDAGSSYYTRRKNFHSFLISYTYEGEGYLEYEGKSYFLKEGDGFFIDCRNPHYYRTEGMHWKHSDLHFSGSFSEYIYQQYISEESALFHQPLDGKFLPMMEKLIELHETIDPFRELRLSSQLERLLVFLLCKTPQYEENIKKIPEHLKYLISYIENNYASPLTLDYLSEFSNISKYHLCRLFKKYMGFTPNEYIIQLRIENAKKLLKNTMIPANKIGIIVGVQDENYFYRMFKQRTGMTPHDYREQG